LEKAGYAEGRNVAIEYRWAEGDYERLPAMAADLVRREVAVIAAGGGAAPALAAKAATSTIPIVFNVGGDPVKLGLVASLARPGGNLTGFNVVTGALDGKRLGLLRELVPDAGLIVVVLNPKNPNADLQLQDVQETTQRVGQQIEIADASTDGEISAALTRSATSGAAAVLVGADPLFFSRRNKIVGLIAGLGLPAIYEMREFADAGGLISYGTSLTEGYRQVGAYTGAILKGAKPADLPVAQPTKFELVINLKTAKALGLTVPPILLAQADEVIE
jgi:putative ABC transport system substrate-binding protein